MAWVARYRPSESGPSFTVASEHASSTNAETATTDQEQSRVCQFDYHVPCRCTLDIHMIVVVYFKLWADHEAQFQYMFVLFRVARGVISIRHRLGSGERERGPGSKSETSSVAQFKEGEARSSFI